MSGEPGLVRRGFAGVWRTIQWIHTGDEEMSEVFGTNPNKLTAGQTMVSAALITGALFIASGA